MRLGGSLLFFATMSDMRSEDKPGSDFALTEPLVGCGCCVKLFDDVAACCAADADTLSFVPEMCLCFVARRDSMGDGAWRRVVLRT